MAHQRSDHSLIHCFPLFSTSHCSEANWDGQALGGRFLNRDKDLGQVRRARSEEKIPLNEGDKRTTASEFSEADQLVVPTSKKRLQSPPIRRILCGAQKRLRTVAIIPLGRHSRTDSSHLPAASPSRIAGCLFGVAPRRDCPFHPTRPWRRACARRPSVDSSLLL